MRAEKPNRRIGRMNWFLGILAGLLIIIVLLAVSALIGGAIKRSQIRATYPPLGQMVDVGEHKLHIYCQCAGSPTVLLLAGSGVPSTYWWAVQTEIARVTRVCAYDRAGYAWSDEPTGVLSPTDQVNNLTLLLEGAGVQPPYVLVGHSYGGYIARLYAQTYPGQVVGLVMVDSAHEQQFVRYPEKIQAATGEALSSLDSPIRRLLVNLLGSVQALLPRNRPEAAYLPPDIAQMTAALMSLHPLIPYTIRAEISEMVLGQAPAIAALGDLPMIVITHGVPTAQAGLSEEGNAEVERVWLQLQEELLSLSTNSKQMIAEQSTHDEIPLKESSLVVQATLDVLAQAQAGD